MGRETREGGEDGREKDEGAGDLWVLSQVTDRRPAASEAQRSQGSWRRADRLKMVLKSMGEQARRKTAESDRPVVYRRPFVGVHLYPSTPAAHINGNFQTTNPEHGRK